jgi:hypothetical protein
MNPKPENFPNALRTSLKWLVWSPQRKPDGDFTKIPLNPNFAPSGVGKKARSNSPDTLGSLELATQTYERFQSVIQPETGMRLGGLGYVNQGDFLAIDFDDCLTDGKPNAEVAELVEELNSYTEISPSGNGLKILLEIPDGLKVNTTKKKLNFRGLAEAEAWTQGKYTTLTGHLYAPHLNEIRRNDGAVRAFLAGIEKQGKDTPPPQTQTSSGGLYVPPPTERDWTEAEVRQMLNHVSADVGNDDWVKIGMALKTWDPSERGRAVFVNWSATAPNRFDDRDANTRWNSFSPQGNGAGRVTMGTLVKLAKQGGFNAGGGKNPPPEPKPQPDQEATIEREVDEWEARLVPWKDLDKIPPAEPILDKWYFKSSVTLITGEQGTCKSLIALAHSALISTGGNWLGLFDIIKTGPVLYLYLESPGGACVRAKGVMNASGLKEAPDVLFDIVPANLFDPAVLERFVRLIKRKGFVLVIVDVALSVFGAFGKSTTDDMGAFSSSCRTIATSTEAGVAIIHHPPKSDADGAHGGMESFALADVWWVGTKKGELVEFKNRKQKEGEAGKPVLLAKKKVPLGGLVVGDSVVVELANQGGRAEEATMNDLAFLKALKKVQDSNGGPVPAGEWKDLATSCRYKMAKGSFGDSRVRLIDLGLVQKSGKESKPYYEVSLAGVLFLKDRGRNE